MQPAPFKSDFAVLDVVSEGWTMMDRPSYEDFLDQVPVDGKTVMREAIHFARIERKGEVKAFGRRHKSLYETAKYGMQRALDRENMRRGNIAGRLWRESLDPVTLEIRQIEGEIARLLDKRLGKIGYARQWVDEQIAAYAARLAELKRPYAEAAE